MLAIGIPWLHGSVAVGDATLARLPEVLAAARQRLSSPTLVLPLGWVQWPDAENTLRALGAGRWSPPRGAEVEGEVLELGPYLVVTHGTAGMTKLWLRPAGLADWAGADPIIGLLDRHTRPPVHAARFLLGPDAVAIAARAASSPLPPGAFEADPAASAPATVAATAESLGVPSDAARLFLQLLALPAPTKASVQRWNGWDGKAWTAAGKALVDAGHVTVGQRSRAGRDIFLTGAWVELPAPDVPVETWKLSLYGATPGADGSVTTPLDRLLPQVPLHRLFEGAWARWAGGDRPGFVEPPGRRRA